MILPVYIYGHPVLRRVAEPVPRDMEGLQEFIADMWATMYHSQGVGLAAPQVGKSLRLLVVDGSILADQFPEMKDLKIAAINPELEVLEDGAPVSRDEGCLSLPGLSESVKRFEHVRMRWFDEDWNEHEQEFSGFFARMLQHEFDHLEGKVYTDRVSPIRRSMLRNKLNALSKGRVSCDYKTVTAK